MEVIPFENQYPKEQEILEKETVNLTDETPDKVKQHKIKASRPRKIRVIDQTKQVVYWGALKKHGKVCSTFREDILKAEYDAIVVAKGQNIDMQEHKIMCPVTPTAYMTRVEVPHLIPPLNPLSSPNFPLKDY